MFSILAAMASSSGEGLSGPNGGLSMILTSAVVAALVSAVVTLIGHKIARQNALLASEIARENARLSAALESAKKLADSRQNWIDQLRDDMASFLALSYQRNRAKESDSKLSIVIS